MNNKEAALLLAAAGVPIFPCKGGAASGDDVKKPVNGVYWRKASTTDPRQIERWWNSYPESIPAIDLAKSGLVAIDCDPVIAPGDPDGVAWFRALAHANGTDIDKLPSTISGRGGRHIFVKQPPGATFTNARGSLPPKKECGVDVRGAGGYVVAAGATLPDGRKYLAQGSLADAPEMPAWLAAILAGKADLRLDGKDGDRDRPVSSSTGHSGDTTAPRSAPSPGGADPFFRAVNDLALANLSAWVPTIFGSAARYQSSTGAYRVSSKALGRDLEEDLSLAPTGIIDFGIHDMGDVRQGRRTAIDIVIGQGRAADAKGAALWLCDRLGRDPASLGFDGGKNPAKQALGAAVARNLIEQGDGTIYDQDTGEVIGEPEKPAAVKKALSTDAPDVPGLVGDIANWIVASSRMPQPVLALGAALVVVGTAIGRDVAGPTLSATHLYVIGLAPTGSGKDHNLQQCGALLKSAGMGHHLGPSEFISMTSVINVLKRSPLALCAQDEFGAFLKRVNARKANNFEGATLKVLRTMWGSSFKPMMTPEWASISAIEIDSPAVSIFGASTEEEFYAALEGLDKDNGVLNRFMIMAAPSRPSEREPITDPLEVPASIKERLSLLYTRSGVLAAAQRNAPRLDVRPVKLVWGADQAGELYNTFRTEIEERGDADPVARPFLARVVETAIRVATIVAAGRFSATVDYEDMEIGKTLALQSAEAMIRGAKDHMAETDTEASHNRIVRAIKAAGGRMSKRDVLRMMRHLKSRELDELIKSMIASEILIEALKEPTTAGGRPSVSYVLIE